MNLRLGTPETLAPHHRMAPFDCGEPSRDDWVKRRALANQQTGASRTFVVAELSIAEAAQTRRSCWSCTWSCGH